MTEHVASRTLVKSPPELWAECSDATSLARHLDQFGEIRITRLDPETAVAWEGERARGTVRIEPSGWGTKVILTAVAVAAEPLEASEPPAAPEPREDPGPPIESEPFSEPEPEPVAVAEPVEAVEPATDPPDTDPPGRRRRFSRLFEFLRAPAPEPPPVEPPPGEPDLTPEPELQAEPGPAPEPEPVAVEAQVYTPTRAATEPPVTEAVLTAALESLGQAHHRPYSRA
jgi:hypothetical protein